MYRLAAIISLSIQLASADKGCAVFGQNLDDEGAISQSVYYPDCLDLVSETGHGISIDISYGIWATSLGGSYGQYAVFSQNNSAPGVSLPSAGWVSLWAPDPNVDDGGSSKIQTLSLGECTVPAGASYDAVENKLYVACFGDDQNNGLLVIELSEEEEGNYAVSEMSFYGYPDLDQGDDVHHVHNAYVFDDEVYVAILGDPWGTPTTSGQGLVRFDRSTKTFDSSNMQIDARAATQSLMNESIFYVLTQYAAEYSTLYRLAMQPDKTFVIEASIDLTVGNFTNGVEGGADVFVNVYDGEEYIWATDRMNNNPGQLYNFLIDPATNEFQNQTVRSTGTQPRYTTMFSTKNGESSIITCNQAGTDLSYFAGLGNNPSDADGEASTIVNPIDESLPLMFFIGDI